MRDDNLLSSNSWWNGTSSASGFSRLLFIAIRTPTIIFLHKYGMQ